MSTWRHRAFMGPGGRGRLARWRQRLADVVPLDLGALNGLAGIRAACACALPVVAGELTHNPSFSWIAIAGFWGCLCDSGGAWGERLLAMGLFAVLGALGTFVAVLLHASLPAAVAFTFAWCFACSLARIYGNAANVLGIVLNVAVLVTLGIPASGPALATQLALLTALGSVWAMLLALVLWRMQPYAPARRAVARCWEGLGVYARTLSRLHRGPRHDPAAWHEPTASCKRALREALESARTVVVATRRTRAGVTGTGQVLLALLADVDQAYAALVSVNEVLEAAAPVAAGDDSGIRRALHVALGRLAARAASVAAVIDGSRRAKPARRIDGLIQAVQQRIAQDGRQAHYAYLVDLLREMSRWIDAAHDNLGDADAPGVAAVRIEESRLALRARISGWTELLRANLSFASVPLRHALRLAVTAAVAVLVTGALGISRGYWISVTAISVLQPYLSETWRRTFDRIAGSVLGGLFGALLIQRVGNPMELAFLLFPLSVLAFTLRSVNYALFILCITPIVVVIAELFRPLGIGDAHLASLRAADSVLGGVIGLLASVLLWPSWQKSQLRGQTAAAIRAHRDFFLVVAGERPGVLAADVALARRAAGLASNNAEASLQRAFSEAPLRGRGEAEPILIMLACLRRMGAAITTLSFLPQFAPGTMDTERFRGLREWTRDALSSLAEALERRRAPPPLPPLPAAPEGARCDAAETILGNELARIDRQLSVLHEAAGRQSRFVGRPPEPPARGT